jgi:hypothetical protein
MITDDSQAAQQELVVKTEFLEQGFRDDMQVYIAEHSSPSHTYY